MEPTNKQKSKFAIKYARHLLDGVGLLNEDRTYRLKDYANLINSYRKDGNLDFTKKQARRYLFDIAVNNKGLVK